MTDPPEDDWQKDEEFMSFLMVKYKITHDEAMAQDVGLPAIWEWWSAGRSAGEATHIQPRPMSDAPKDGTTVRLFMTGFCMVTPNKKGKVIEEWYPGPPTGWLPLLDEKDQPNG